MQRLREHALERATMVFVKICDECFQSQGFLPEISRRTNQLFQIRDCGFANAANAEDLRVAKISQRFLDILPTGVLSEECSNDYFKAGASRPPVQRSVSAGKNAVKAPNLDRGHT